MENETNRCSQIVSNLLAFSRKSELEFTDVTINELVEKCLMLSGHKLRLSNISLDRTLAGGFASNQRGLQPDSAVHHKSHLQFH